MAWLFYSQATDLNPFLNDGYRLIGRKLIALILALPKSLDIGGRSIYDRKKLMVSGRTVAYASQTTIKYRILP